MLILISSFGQSLFRDGADSVHIAEEMDDMLATCHQRDVALDDDAVSRLPNSLQKISIGLLLVVVSQPNHRSKDRWKSIVVRHERLP
jgi:hypothetical protein